ncbi:MAG: hypothetical protein AAB866_00840 [Patescibacteria group bacterium]
MKFFNFFDKLEDKVRAKLSHYPIIYTIIGGVAIVVFWRGIWEIVDTLAAKGGIWSILLSGPISVILSVSVLLLTGLFVSFFVGDTILMTGLKKEKKIIERTEAELKSEVDVLQDVEKKLEHIEEELKDLTSL